MKCMNCKKEITEENKQHYKFGLKLPYCKPCTDGYNEERQARLDAKDVAKARTVWSTMSAAKRRQALQRIRKQLRAKGLRDEEIDEKLREEGLIDG